MRKSFQCRVNALIAAAKWSKNPKQKQSNSALTAVVTNIGIGIAAINK